MAGHPHIGSYYLFQEEEQTPIHRSVRAGEIDGGKLTQHVRLDIFQRELAADRAFADQLAQHSASASKLQHPNILRHVGSIQQDGQLASVNEYMEGFSLAQVLSRSRSEGFPFSIDHALLVASKLVTALDQAKAQKVTHGFLNPTFLFISNEGEVKIKGFATSAALRSVLAGHTGIADQFRDYLPEHHHAGAGDHARFDIFASGVLLFEMLTGEAFYAQGRQIHAKERIMQTPTAADAEPIPPTIARIILNAIDPGAPEAFRDIRQVVAEMEKLLFSGEYSPTTFNLAFFMHSAFRAEIEEFTTRIAEEKAKDFGRLEKSLSSTPPPLTIQPTPAARQEVILPTKITESPLPVKEKSKLRLFLGLGAAVVVIATAAFFALGGKPKEPTADPALLAQQKALLEQAEVEERRQKEEMMQAELTALRQQLDEEQRAREAREKESLEAEIKETEYKLKLAQEEKNRQFLEQQIQEREAALAASKAKAEAKANEERAAANRRPAENRSAENRPSESLTPENPSPSTAEPAASERKGEAVSPRESTVAETSIKETRTEPQPVRQPEPEPVASNPPSPPAPPKEGDLVEHDEYVTVPALLDKTPRLEIPAKAVKAGAFRPGSQVLYLLQVLVNDKGKVEDVKVIRPGVPAGSDDFGMEEEAVRTARKLRWQPGTKMGVKIRIWTSIGVSFKAF